MIRKGGLTVDDRLWTKAHERLLKRAASYPEVERILVHPGIKKKLCDTVKGDRSWLRKIRPFWGHDYHFHVRIGCQAGSTGCKRQEATVPGEGCDKSLAWWFTEEPWRPNKNPDAPKARDLMTMASLPKECRAVLNAPDPVSEAAVTVGPGVDAVAVARAGAAGAATAAPAPDRQSRADARRGCHQRLYRNSGNGHSAAASPPRPIVFDASALIVRADGFSRTDFPSMSVQSV